MAQPQSALRQIPTQSAEPFVRSYNPFNPAFRDTVRSGINELIGGREMGGTPTQRYRAGIADLLTGAVDFVPGVGEAVGVADTMQAARGGNYGTAAMLGGATALGMLPVVGDAASKAVREGLDMSQAARMQRAAEQGYTDRLRHSSSEVFAGSPQAEEAMKFGIPIQNEFKKDSGGTYFSPDSDLTEDIFAQNPFGGSAEYLINKGNNFNANYKSMSESQKKELSDIIGTIVDADDIDNAFEVFTDGDFYQTYGRRAQDNLMKAFSMRGYDSVTFPDNLATGDMTQSTVVFDPSNIRSVNAAFDPAKRGSANLMAGAAGATVGLSALRNIQRDEEPQRKPD